MKRQDLGVGRQICSDAELLAGDRHGEVCARRSPQLEANGVGCSAVKDKNTQAVFEPAKEQFGGIGSVASDLLVGAQVGGALNLAGCDNIVTHIGATADDEESTGFGNASQATKVDVATIHDVEGPGLMGSSSSQQISP